MSLDPPSQALNFLLGTARGTGKHTVIKEAWEHSWYLKNPAQPLWTVPTSVFSIPLTKSASTLEAGLKSQLSRGGKLQTSGPAFLQNPVSHGRGLRVPHCHVLFWNSSKHKLLTLYSYDLGRKQSSELPGAEKLA